MNIERKKLSAYLNSISLFSALDLDECELLADSARQVVRKAGQILLHEGETLSYVYILTTGSGACYFLRPGGKKSIIYHIRPDRPFAVEVALMGSRLSGVIEITESATVLSIPVAPIKNFMESNAAFANQVARYAMDSYLRLTDFLKDLSFGAPARLSRFLFRRALEAGTPHGDGISFDLGLRKSALADYLGITPETLSRTFSQLQSEGVISVEGPRIIVSNVRDLVRLSEGFYKED
ncbi:MAG: Crp/Fnr family transcriptional regulator [Coriobacteriia bacterium]|nr:Crp/Fnr family transcriptional regulator [Coriobacteriia bacterium]